MKKTIAYVMFALVIYVSTPQPTHAIWCGNCKQIWQGTIDIVKETFTAISAGTSAMQQTILTLNETVGKPLKAAMAAAQIVQSNNMIQNLIAGKDPLLVSNPAVYLQNKGIGVTQGGIDALAGQSGIFGDSLIGSLVSSAKTSNSGLPTKLAAINQSNIPSIAQSSICGNDSALSSYVKSNLSLLGGDYTTAKQNAYNSLCKGNPSTDPALAKKLAAVNAANPTLDSFYDIAMGDNAYTKATLANIATQKAADDAKAAAAKDMTGGIKSQTTCKTKASNGLCIDETKTQSSSVLLASYNKSLGSGIDQSLASISGGLFSSLLPGLNLMNSLTSAFGGAGGNSVAPITPGAIIDPRTGVATTFSNTSATAVSNTTATQTTGFSQDLLNNPKAKADLSDSPSDYLKQHLTMLDDLKKTDDNFTITIQSYNSQLASMKACYDGIVTDFFGGTIPTPTDDRFNAAYNFYKTKKNANDVTSVVVNNELNKINITKTLINNTLDTINKSNSTDEITAAFKNYQDQIKSQGLPDINSGGVRAGQQAELDGEIQISVIEGGNIYNLNATCATWKVQLTPIWGAFGRSD